MRTYHQIIDATLPKILLSLSQCFFILAIHHIGLRLSSLIATLQPISMVSCQRRHGNVVLPHQTVQYGTTTIEHAVWVIQYSTSTIVFFANQDI